MQLNTLNHVTSAHDKIDLSTKQTDSRPGDLYPRDECTDRFIVYAETRYGCALAEMTAKISAGFSTDLQLHEWIGIIKIFKPILCLT